MFHVEQSIIYVFTEKKIEGPTIVHIIADGKPVLSYDKAGPYSDLMRDVFATSVRNLTASGRQVTIIDPDEIFNRK